MMANWEIHFRDTRDPKASGKTAVVVAEDIVDAVTDGADAITGEDWTNFKIDSARMLNELPEGD